MERGIASDLHCNIDSLDRALEAMDTIDALLCLGDSMYQYRFSNAVIGRVLVVNPGSAGESRDPRSGGQLSCVVLDTATEEVVMRDFPALAKR